MNEETHICEHCGNTFTGDWRKDPRTPPRFCCKACSNSHQVSEEHKQKTRNSVAKFLEKATITCPICHRRFSTEESYHKHESRGHAGLSRKQKSSATSRRSRKEYLDQFKKEKQARRVRIRINHVVHELNITNEELDAYREQHPVCEICGNTETLSWNKEGRPNKLCADHNHATGQFRGVLCHNCNSRLGWYEAHKDLIDKYLLRGKQ